MKKFKHLVIGGIESKILALVLISMLLVATVYSVSMVAQDDIQLKGFPQRESQQRHNGKLADAPDQNAPGMTEHVTEVLRFQRQSHAEHDRHQQRVDPGCLHPQCGCWQKQGYSRQSKNDDRHELSDDRADGFDFFIVIT